MTRPVLIASLLLVAACRTFPALPTTPSDDPAFEQPVVPALPGLPVDPEPPERVLPGDTISLKTISVEPLDLPDLIVDVSGYVHVPVAGPVLIGGRTIEEASNLVEAQLHRYDSHAQVQLRIINATGHHATVLGTVGTQGVYPLTPGMRLADLLAKCGGPLQTVDNGEQIDVADVESARVLRHGAALPVSISRALVGDPLHNILIHADDMVIVPPSRGQRITVLGHAGSSKVIPFRSGLRLSDTIAMAGGIADIGDDGDIRVIRGPLTHPRVYRASLGAMTRGSAHDVMLAPGDVVYVSETFLGTYTEVLARITPLLLLLNLARAYTQ